MVVDSILPEEFNEQEMRTVLLVGLVCSHLDPKAWPTMSFTYGGGWVGWTVFDPNLGFCSNDNLFFVTFCCMLSVLICSFVL